MGACCSKEGNFGSFGDKKIAVSEDEYDQLEDHVQKGDFGASVRLQGFSEFVSMATLQGKKGINQDAMTVWEDFNGDKESFFCGVFDGHGPCGHKVARAVRDQIPTKLSAAQKHVSAPQKHVKTTTGRNQSYVDAMCEYLEKESAAASGDDNNGTFLGEDDPEATSVYHSWKANFLKAFKEVDKELSLDSSIECYCSGSTAVTVVKQGDHLIIGNLGDSRAVLCTREKGQIIPVQLTVDLKPSLPKEAERVHRCKGRVYALNGEPHVLRLWLPDEDSPGLAMTRALGDFCLKDYGLISVPQVFYRKLSDHDEFVVLATDGVWDVLTNLEVVKIVSSARKRSLAAKFLAIHAIRAWKSRFPASRTDDIAVVILYFKPLPPTKSMSDLSHITPDSLSHLNSSVSQYSTRRSISSSDADDGFEFKDSFKGKSQDSSGDWGEGESLVDTSLNFPLYSSARHRARSTSRDGDL